MPFLQLASDDAVARREPRDDRDAGVVVLEVSGLSAEALWAALAQHGLLLGRRVSEERNAYQPGGERGEREVRGS